MKNLVLLLAGLFLITTLQAQECTDENVAGLPGKWLPAMKGDHDHAAADIAKERVILDNIAQIIRSNFTWQPAGGDITAGHAYSIRGLDYRPTPVRKIANTYSHFIFFQHYFCNHGKINREDYGDRLSVTVNMIPIEFPRTFFISKVDQYGNPMQEDPENDKYGYIKEMPVVNNGYFTYTKDGRNPENHRILVKGGQLPFKLLSKKEYYEKWILQNNNTIQLLTVTKEKMAVLAKTSGNNSDVEYEERRIQQQRGYIDKINRTLSERTAEELSRPALSGEENGEFLDNKDPGNRHDYVIVPNLAYYNAALPKSAPQLIYIDFDCQDVRNRPRSAPHYADEIFVAELEKIHIVDLLTEKLKPLLAN